MMVVATTAVRLYGKQDGSGAGAGIEALGLCVRIKVGRYDLVVSASPVDDDAWCEATLNQRLPDVVRVLNLMMETRAGGRQHKA